MKKNNDIIQLILEDHKPLKELIEIMKDTEKHDILERTNAFEEFAPLLTVHAKAEERSLYVHMKSEEDMTEEGLEGDVEHGLADQLVHEIRATEDEDLWSAKVKVLAELVEHHIEEEEEEQFPEFKKQADAEVRSELGQQYLLLKSEITADENASEIAERHQDQVLAHH